MMEELIYWTIEYIKVLLGYGFIMFVWPSAVFRKYLKGKSVTFRFGFCATVPIVLINSVVLLLGLVHVLNQWILGILFYGSVLWSFRGKISITEDTGKKFKALIAGTFGWKHFFLLTGKRVISFLKRQFKKLWKLYRMHWLEYTLLMVAVVYGMIYFSWGVWHEHSYGFSDMYVHHSWVYQLSQGNPFAGGIYPQGMHCLLYGVSALFGVRIFSCMLFVPGVNMALIIVAAYCFMKELFRWRFSAVFALFIFLTMELTNRIFMISMARAQCALPQEIGFPTVLLCALFLLRYLKSKKNVAKEKNTKDKWWMDENLFLFVMAFSGTVIIHFYDTLMAFYLCLAIAIVCWKKVFTKDRFIPLVAAVIIGLVIAIVPMVTGAITGIKLEGSLYWAMSLIKGSTSTSTEIDVDVQEESYENNNSAEDISTGSEIEQYMPQETAENNNVSVEAGTTYDTYETYEKKETIADKVLDKTRSILQSLQSKWKAVCEKGIYVMYGQQRGNWLIVLTIGICVLWLLYRIVSFLANARLKIGHMNAELMDGYFIIVLAACIYLMSYVPYEVGIPMLMEGYRTGFINHMLVVMLVVVPLDILYIMMQKIIRQNILITISAMTSVAIVAYIYLTGNWHGYLYFEVTRYNATVELTNDIISSLPKHSYTIISPTEELYQTIEYGRHEEILNFLQNQSRQSYTIPTEYVILYVEKRPLRYAQYHFFDGPEWVAVGKYQDIYGGHSVWPEYLSVEISEEEASKGILYYALESHSYTKVESRIILESKMYEWCKRFNELYPNELKVLYEDDELICYYFKQNVNSLYNLALQ